ncbi:MAG: hypothetical protein KIS94_15930 [Chitinophagales bacterium]|nr:hypothetical protein [Chitinophagales bacterium]
MADNSTSALSVIQRWISIGVKSHTSLHQRRYILLTNSINFTTLFLIPPYAILFYALGYTWHALFLIPVFFLIAIPLFLTYMQYYMVARILLLFLLNLILGVYALLFGRESGIHLLYMVFSTVPLLLFPLRNFPYIISSWFVSVVCYCVVRYEFILLDTQVNANAQQVISFSIVLLTFVWLLLNFYYLIRANASQEKDLKKQNEMLKNEAVERKAAEQKLKEYNRQLRIKNREVEQFTHVAAHDLQEPLRIITSYTQLLQRHATDKLDTVSKQYMNHLLQGTSRLKSLMTDLLDYFDISTLQNVEDVNCNDLLNDIVTNLKDAYPDKQFSIKYSNLPIVYGNRHNLRSLFFNLLDNAIKFNRDGINPEVAIEDISTPDYWKFAVSDNGIGIEEKYLKNMFTIFQRLHSIERYEGTGIGLAQCKKIVELHGGRIWVESVAGKGSTFFFTLKK